MLYSSFSLYCTYNYGPLLWVGFMVGACKIMAFFSWLYFKKILQHFPNSVSNYYDDIILGIYSWAMRILERHTGRQTFNVYGVGVIVMDLKWAQVLWDIHSASAFTREEGQLKKQKHDTSGIRKISAQNIFLNLMKHPEWERNESVGFHKNWVIIQETLGNKI